MDAKLQRRVQRYGWDKAAGSYEQFWQQQLRPAHDLLMELAAIQSGDRVLDVAAGTGLITFRAAAAAGSAGYVVGTDISDMMVESISQEAAVRKLTHVTAKRLDAEQLDFSDDSFDVALCALGLMYVPDPLAALREMHRVLRPGGRAVAAVWGARSKCGWAEIFPIVDSRVQSDVCPMFFQLGTGTSLVQAFRDAGYTRIEDHRISTVLHYDSPEEACGAAFEGGPVALAYSRFDNATREGARAEYIESITPWRSGNAFDVPGEFVVVLGFGGQ
jgi:ubiquinone/menaquinone biosynthesis C-methylase UbiE